MNALPKIVFSRTLEMAPWKNTRLVKENIADEVVRLKQEPGMDMVVFGSSDMALTLIRSDLIDEYRIIVNPVVLGNDISLFKGIHEKLKLRLLRTETLHSGNVILYYEPDRRPQLSRSKCGQRAAESTRTPRGGTGAPGRRPSSGGPMDQRR